MIRMVSEIVTFAQIFTEVFMFSVKHPLDMTNIHD